MESFFEKFFGVSMTPVYIVSQIFGFAGLTLIVMSYQTRTQKNILRFQACSGAMFTVSFFLQSAYNGCFMNLIGIARSVIYSNCKDIKWANNIAFPIVFSIIFAAASYFSHEGALSLLPLGAMLITTWAHRSTSAAVVRLLSLPGSLAWMAYNALIGNISGLATEIFVSTSIIVGICRCDIPVIKEKIHKPKK